MADNRPYDRGGTLSSISSHSGVHTRTLELHGAPFEKESDAQKMHEITSYGHAGPGVHSQSGRLPPRQDQRIPHTIYRFTGWSYKDKRLFAYFCPLLLAVADQLVSEWLFGIEPGRRLMMP